MDDGPRDARDERWQPTRIVGDPTITLRYPLEDEDGKVLLRAGTVLRVQTIYITEHGLGVDVYANGEDGYHIDEYYPYGNPWEQSPRWFSWGGKLDDGKRTYVFPHIIAGNIIHDMEMNGERVWSLPVREEMERRLKGAF